MSVEIRALATKKALQSQCRYLVSAIGLNRKGEVLFSAFNRSRFNRYGGTVHAEMQVMLRAGPGLRTIVIARVNKQGDMLPIKPCPACAEKAAELGLKITTLE